MKTKVLLVVAAIFGYVEMSNAQQDNEEQKNSKFIRYNIEFGITGRSTDDIKDRPNMRHGSSFDECLDFGHDAHVRQYHFDFKPEFKINRKLSYNVGLRLTNCIGELTSSNIWCVDSEGTTSQWITTSFISQRAFYVGVPAELRFVAGDLDGPSFVLKTGIAANVLVHKKNRAKSDYNDNVKAEYLRRIEKYVGTPDRVTVPVWLSAGCQVGSDGDVTIEVKFPVLMRYNNTFSMCEFEFGGIGLAMGFRIPSF